MDGGIRIEMEAIRLDAERSLHGLARRDGITLMHPDIWFLTIGNLITKNGIISEKMERW